MNSSICGKPEEEEAVSVFIVVQFLKRIRAEDAPYEGRGFYYPATVRCGTDPHQEGRRCWEKKKFGEGVPAAVIIFLHAGQISIYFYFSLEGRRREGKSDRLRRSFVNPAMSCAPRPIGGGEQVFHPSLIRDGD